jgi:hypothetical protein
MWILLAQASATDWTAVWTVVAVGVTVLFGLIGVVWQAGRLTQKVEGLSGRISEGFRAVKERNDKADERFDALTRSVQRLDVDQGKISTKIGMKTEAEHDNR